MVWDEHVGTTVYEEENQHGPTYGTGNSTRYPIVARNSKRMKKFYIETYACVSVYNGAAGLYT